MAKAPNEENLLSSVKNALRILHSFTMDEPEKKIGELSASLGLNKSTVSRTMATLASEGFVYKDPDTKRYRLGLSILSLSGVVNSNMDIYRESQPVLHKLVDTLGETAHLSFMDQLDVIYIQKVECNHPVRFLTHVGKRNPAYCTSSGKILLAHSDQSIIDQVISNGLKKYTDHTITDPDKLIKHLKEIKEQGFSYSYEEFLEGVNSIAAPIFDYTGKAFAALSIVGPKQRIEQNKTLAYSKKVISAAKEISSRIGYLR
jgi:IclR family KDG regulon transcriptional repressor